MPKIMIVDDDRTTVRLLQKLLEMDGFESTAAANGQIALNMVDEARPDVFLVDYHLADMNGVELVTRLRSDPRFGCSPIVMASGLDKEDEALKAGADAFLLKPFEPEDMIDLFLDLLG